MRSEAGAITPSSWRAKSSAASSVGGAFAIDDILLRQVHAQRLAVVEERMADQLAGTLGAELVRALHCDNHVVVELELLPSGDHRLDRSIRVHTKLFQGRKIVVVRLSSAITSGSTSSDCWLPRLTMGEAAVIKIRIGSPWPGSVSSLSRWSPSLSGMRRYNGISQKGVGKFVSETACSTRLIEGRGLLQAFPTTPGSVQAWVPDGSPLLS